MQHLTYDAFKLALEDADRRFTDRHIARYTQRLLPALETFNSFAAGIMSLVQASGNSVAGFVWGSLQVILVVSFLVRGMRGLIS